MSSSPESTAHQDTATTAPLLVLASQSPSRVSILTQSGVAFEQLVSGVDEDAALAREEERVGRHLSAAETAQVLARTKAEAVAGLPQTEGRLVLGCDSVFELDGRQYGKPGTPELARERIRGMSGRTGVLHTGHWLVDRREDAATPVENPRALGETRSAKVSFAELSEAEIEAYVATGEPLWVAGSFTIEGYGAPFIAGIEGESHTVLGLSMNALRGMLARRGVGITRLWVPST